MPAHLDPRLLRAFLAVAEDLHFTRAAARLYVAQQALSRDIRRLERELGATLFVRTTRQVTLTLDGERLLPYARRALAAQDELLSAFGRPDAERPLLVDVNSPGLVSGRVLALARELAPDCELMTRFESGLTGAAAELLAGRLDASFGRFVSLDPAVRARLEQQPVRYEPMAVVLPEDHRLAGLDAIPLDALAGEQVYAGAGNPRTLEWTDLARQLFEGRGIEVAAPATARRRHRGVPKDHGQETKPGSGRDGFSGHAEIRPPAPGRPRTAVTGVVGVAQGTDASWSEGVAHGGGATCGGGRVAGAPFGGLDSGHRCTHHDEPGLTQNPHCCLRALHSWAGSSVIKGALGPDGGPVRTTSTSARVVQAPLEPVPWGDVRARGKLAGRRPTGSERFRSSG